MKGSIEKHQPLVSIAMATYNGKAHIREQLDSVLSQTFKDFELIIVDDFSTDDTRTLIRDYQQKDHRVQLFFNESNIGYRQTFYKAINYCKGRYILFCDQDDIWVNHKVETLLATIKENLLIFSDSELINEKGNSLNIKLSDTVRMVQPGAVAINRGFVAGNCVWGHTIMFHRSLLNYVSVEQNNHPHDWWFAVVSSHLNKIKYCPMVLNYYRQHANNVTQAIPVKRGSVAGRKTVEFETQFSRIKSIAALPFNTDKSFYVRWQQLYIQRKTHFSFTLLRFLFTYRHDIFSLKKKNVVAQLVEIRKMCRKVAS